jgi:nitrogen fixation protein FixH
VSAAVPAAPRQRGSWIPWLFVGFFLAIIAVNGTMVWLALESWTGLASNQAYDQGLAYNRNLEAARRQEALGWRPKLHAHVGADLAGVADLALADALGQPLAGATVTMRLERPTDEGADLAVTMIRAGPGVYRGEFALPLAGAWNAHVTIRRGDDLFVHEQRLVLP